MVVVDGIYIHESGGKTLLEYFVFGLIERKKEFALLLDSRMETDIFKNADLINIFRLDSSEKGRRHFYKANEDRITKVFCFANVPPPKLNRHIFVWILFHNSLILTRFYENNSYSFKSKILFFLRRFYIWYRKNPDYKWIVQTENMKMKLIQSLYLNEEVVFVMPFFSKNSKKKFKNDDTVIQKFLYVADGVSQKNHIKLLEAWKILYDKYNLTFELNLTVPARFTDLRKYIQKLIDLGLQIKNHGLCNKDELQRLYTDSTFLIFPSLSESFGLPLLEGAGFGCKIIASDLPFVNDVIYPTATFNPYSAEDIAKVVAELTNSSLIGETVILIDDHLEKIIDLIYEN